MRHLWPAVAASALFFLAYDPVPASAAPAAPSGVAAPDSGIEQAARRRKRRVVRAPRGESGTNVGQPARRVPQRGGTAAPEGPAAAGPEAQRPTAATSASRSRRERLFTFCCW